LWVNSFCAKNVAAQWYDQYLVNRNSGGEEERGTGVSRCFSFRGVTFVTFDTDGRFMKHKPNAPLKPEPDPGLEIEVIPKNNVPHIVLR
jgi:hypothetical protein